MIHIGRGFLLSIGCIQALRCHTNTCPAGITTQNRWLQSGLDPADKGARVANYSLAIERDIVALTHACGLADPRELSRRHVMMNVGPGVRTSMADLAPGADDATAPGIVSTSFQARQERERVAVGIGD